MDYEKYLNDTTFEFFEKLYYFPENLELEMRKYQDHLIQDEIDDAKLDPVFTPEIEMKCLEMLENGCSDKEVKEYLENLGFQQDEIDIIFEIWSARESAAIYDND